VFVIVFHFLAFLAYGTYLRYAEVGSSQSTVGYGSAKTAYWELRTVLVPK